MSLIKRLLQNENKVFKKKKKKKKKKNKYENDFKPFLGDVLFERNFKEKYIV